MKNATLGTTRQQRRRKAVSINVNVSSKPINQKRLTIQRD